MENPTAGWSQSVHATPSNPRQSILEPFLSLFPKWIGRLSQVPRRPITIYNLSRKGFARRIHIYQGT